MIEKTKKLKPNSTYLIITRSTSKTAFFDSPNQIKVFENLCQTFLAGMCKIEKLLCINKGYVMIIRTKSAKVIKEAYRKQREKSNKSKVISELKEVWQMISEHFRFMGCSFVTITNKYSGRTGTKFHRSYERYSIQEDEVDQIARIMEIGEIVLEQRVKQFQLGSKVKKWFYKKTSFEQNNTKEELEIESYWYRNEGRLVI